MTTYWAVIAIVIGATTLVLLALWYQLAPGGPGRNRRWVALGTSFTPMSDSRSWVAAIEVGREAEGIDLTAAGVTLSGVIAGQLGPALAARPSAAVIWVGPSDLLAGTPLTTFLRDLTMVIGRLQHQGCQVLLIGLPDLAGPSHGSARRRDPLAPAIDAWRNGLRETGNLTGATLIAVPFGRASRLADGAMRLAGPVPWIEPALHASVGTTVSPLLRQALQNGRYPASPSDQWDEPADPVQRRRLGLPRVR